LIAHAGLFERLLQFLRRALVLADLVKRLAQVVAELALVRLRPHARLRLEKAHVVEFLLLLLDGRLGLRLQFGIRLLGQFVRAAPAIPAPSFSAGDRR
jgi:hypothetical protein